jgi:formylglycine-generating enzyme required for sulfatase activity
MKALFGRRLSVIGLLVGALAGGGLAGAERVSPATGSLLIQCPVACRIVIEGIGLTGETPTERLSLDRVPVGTYAATFSGFNRRLAYDIVVAEGARTQLVVNIASGKIQSGPPERKAEARRNAPPAPAAAVATAKAGPKRATMPKGNFTLVGLDLTMIAVEPGSFQMGELKGNTNERPVMKVQLTRRYWLGQFEVTRAQWHGLTEGEQVKPPVPTRPMENVSWMQVMEFLRRLNAREREAGRLPVGYVYGLPTEAQWEFAARAGESGTGAETLNARGWHRDNSGNVTRPVGQMQANPWGFHDLLGNLSEWCSDWSAPYPGGEATDPAGPATGTNRAIRGGTFNFDPRGCLFASRSANVPENSHPNVGFRLALIPSM